MVIVPFKDRLKEIIDCGEQIARLQNLLDTQSYVDEEDKRLILAEKNDYHNTLHLKYQEIEIFRRSLMHQFLEVIRTYRIWTYTSYR